MQAMAGKSHGLLQEAGVELTEILKEQGFYTERRVTSTPSKKRLKQSYGQPVPIQLPTAKELEMDMRE